MSDLERIRIKIEMLRVKLEKMIDSKETLLDAETLNASELLDAALNEYYKMQNSISFHKN